MVEAGSMTLEQLRLFVAVAEREHVTAASRALHVTQSAVSAAIAALEERHGVKLFHRVGRGINLTEAGRLFLPQARAVLARAAMAQTVLEEVGGLRRGTLRLVASQTIAAYWLPPILVAFRGLYPDVEVDLAISNTLDAASRVRDGSMELGIVEGLVEDPALAQWRVGEDHLTIIQVGSDVPHKMSREWLCAAQWVMREPGSGTRAALEEYLGQLGVTPRDMHVSLVLPSNEAVRTAIEAGAGVGSLSSLVVAPALLAGTLHAVPQTLKTRAFYGLRHKERYQSRAADALLALIEQQKHKVE